VQEIKKKYAPELVAPLPVAGSTQQTSEVENNVAKIEELREKEQLELIDAIPNAENYLTSGKVDKEKINNFDDLSTFQTIYDKYDKKISPLMENEDSTISLSPKPNDAKVSVKETKDLPLTNNRKVRFESNSGSIIKNSEKSRKRPKNTEIATDDDVKPKDEQKDIDCI
jgi:hypothetical protein